MRHRDTITALIALFLCFSSARGESLRLVPHVEWEKSEKARIFDSSFPISNNSTAFSLGSLNFGPANNVMFRTDMSGAMMGLGLAYPVWGMEGYIRGSHSSNGAFDGPLIDTDYIKLAEGPFGRRYFPGGPATGDSVFSSSPTLDSIRSESSARATVRDLRILLKVNVGSFFFLPIVFYRDTNIKAESVGYVTFLTNSGPDPRFFYAPLSYTLLDFERGAGLGFGNTWEVSSFELEASISIGYLDQNSSFHNYTRNLTVYWDTHGIYAALGISLGYKFPDSSMVLVGSASFYRSSATGTNSMSDIGRLSSPLGGDLPSIARIEERRTHLELALEIPISN
jgi:hypothetical protein